MTARAHAAPDQWRDTRMPWNRCPYCDHELDCASSENGGTPSPGDLSVCICCAQALVFTADLTVRAMTDVEWRNLDAREKAALRRYQAAVRSLDRREMPPP